MLPLQILLVDCHSNRYCKNIAWKVLKQKVAIQIQKSKIIITHGGVGTIMTALKHGKKVIVVPRYKKFGEIADDHQLDITQELEKRRKIIAVYKIDNLSEAIRKAEDVRVTTVMEKQNTNFKEIIIDWLEKEEASL